ncbi:MAG: NAD(P)/FAD-dependent oxidoreductase [Paracoccaceae bacterium]
MKVETLPQHNVYDAIIIGGAMMGAASAWFLSNHPGFEGRILVIERDPTFAQSSTAHTNSCIRQQFSTEINVRVSQFGVQYIRNFANEMGADPDVPDIHMHPFGYMYLASTAEGEQALRAAHAMQSDLGSATRLWSCSELAEAFPFYDLDGIRLGSHNACDEGYFDGATIFDWWRRKARINGVEFIANEVVGIQRQGARVTGIRLIDGTEVAGGTIVNAAGPRAENVARMAGIALPIEPRKRYTYVVEAEHPLDRDLPLTVDPSGVHMRSDGAYYMIGATPDQDPAVAPDDFGEDHGLWLDKVWPIVVTRIPQFEALRVVQSWVGHYAFNTVDQNAIVGPHPEVSNFLMVNGFSGHGFQQSPAMGRGLAEFVVTGAYQTLDLSPFAFERFEIGALLTEKAII